MEKKAINFLLAGVGGQGTLLASDIVAEVGLRAGLDVKKSEVHGMAQRGGAVVSHVRWGEKVASPLIEIGKVDIFIAQETLESLRWLEYLRPGGTVILSKEQLPPTSTVYGNDVYPDEEKTLKRIAEFAGKILFLDAVSVAEELGNRRTANSVLLGALAAELQLDSEDWLAVIEEKVPQKHKEVNRRAFLAGRQGQWELERSSAKA
ncbi:MAG TPA: indolepyruvate oxidoreductase subunit beta [Anaerolineales bacterium]